MSADDKQADSKASAGAVPQEKTRKEGEAFDEVSRLAAERQASGGEERFRAIIDTTPECVKIVAADGTLLHMNSSGLALLGADAESVIGKSVYDLIAPEFKEAFRIFNERICQGEKGSLEFDVVGLQGQRRQMETHAAPLQGPGGIISQLAITHDVTERKRSERAAMLLAAIVDSSDDAIVSKGLDGTVMSWNKGAERLFGYTSDEMVGKPITIIIPEDRLTEEPAILSRIQSGERVDHFETVRRRKDGSLLNISLTISPVRDRNGTIIGASKIARDITDRKRIEEELLLANEDLERFAYSVSHDLQEPLRSIKIYSELLAQRYGGQLEGKGRDFLDYVHQGASQMEILVHDLLAYTQVKKIASPEQETDANDALSAALANLSAAAMESGAEISSDPLPSLRVHSTHLKQLFQNLIGNAIKYRSPDRSPAIHVGAERNGDRWVFSVRDNGMGIQAEYRDQIFGLFKRLHAGKAHSGTGIGLSICQRIVEGYKGRIWVESVAGQGSTFVFTFPV